VLGCLLEPLEQWRRVAPRAAADEGNKTGGSGTSSSSLSPYASGDLQNNQKRSKQLILVFFFFLVHGSVCFHFGFVFLLVSPSSLFKAAGWQMGFCRRLRSYWWPVCAKESGSREAGVTTLWCVAGGWYVGTVEDGSAERGKNGGWPREQEEKGKSWEQGP
jgi:hypothetical protein